jgi:Na+-transporting NADH:ubiquinone oxidoreductase subunit NqrB
MLGGSELKLKNRCLCFILTAFFLSLSTTWAASYYVDATNGKDSNDGFSPSTPWKTISKVNASNFNLGAQISVKGGTLGESNLSFVLQDNKANR